MIGEASDYWRFFAEDARRTGSALYARLAAGIGADADLKALAARARRGQPHANLILGAALGRGREADRDAGDEHQRSRAQRAAASRLPRHRAPGSI